jgi:hypothetical protein
MLGFANKGNAMKTIKSNFIEGEDYKKLLFRTEKQVINGKNAGGAGLNHETVMLNVDTFKILFKNNFIKYNKIINFNI